MPAIKSSSKGASKLTLFANERAALEKSRTALLWIIEHWHAGELIEAAAHAERNIGELLELISDAENNPSGNTSLSQVVTKPTKPA